MSLKLTEFADKQVLYIRGNSENILPVCSYIISRKTGKVSSINGEDRNRIEEVIEDMTAKRLRVIILAYKKINTELALPS